MIDKVMIFNLTVPSWTEITSLKHSRIHSLIVTVPFSFFNGTNSDPTSPTTIPPRNSTLSFVTSPSKSTTISTRTTTLPSTSKSTSTISYTSLSKSTSTLSSTSQSTSTRPSTISLHPLITTESNFPTTTSTKKTTSMPKTSTPLIETTLKFDDLEERKIALIIGGYTTDEGRTSKTEVYLQGKLPQCNEKIRIPDLPFAVSSPTTIYDADMGIIICGSFMSQNETVMCFTLSSPSNNWTHWLWTDEPRTFRRSVVNN